VIAGLRTSRVAAALVVAGLGASIGLQVVRERQYPQVGSPVDEMRISEPEAISRLTLSFKSILADV
jgi:hypothetical protein